MRTVYNTLYVALSMIFFSAVASAQCANNNSPYGSIANLQPGQTGTVYCMYGGEYATVNVVNNATYVFSTCGGSWDTQLTLYSSSGTYLAYNDDACGLQSEITWTATFTGQVRVMLDKWPCSNYYSCMNLNVTRQANQPQLSPCASSLDLVCGNTSSYNLASGNGAWDPAGPYGTPGNEQVYEFTAQYSGIHQISITHSGGGWVDLFIQSGSCSNQSGWTYIDDVYSSATNNVSLIAGQTYQFLIDDENTSASSGTISIDCPTPAPDPCALITALTCDQSSSYDLGSGNGTWDPSSGPWGTPGQEKVFSYTPQISGFYDITVTHNNSGWTDLFYKAGNCDGNGWNYVDDIYSSATNSVYLTAGTNYLFLIDDENTSASTGTISIACPCIGSQVDEIVNLNGNVTLYNNTSGACDDCGLRSSEDITYEINIPCPGTYTIETCDLASWDTYLYLTSAPCSGIMAYNDDNCGLRSSITYSFSAAGTYYVTVEGWSSSAAGAFGLDISRACDLSASLIADEKECGYNISCNGGDNGSIEVIASGCGNLDYNWSNGATASNATHLSAGTYTVTVSDDWGCSVTESMTLTEPDQLVVDAGNDQVVYYGYTPMSCVDLDATVAGGCAEYDYMWSSAGTVLSTADNLSDCPTSDAQYMLTVQDQNGCTATDYVSVCVIDVRCYAGNSGIQKVEMCQVPPGNPSNAHTICVDESAVPAHLAIGCTLGACDEVDDCDVAAKNMESQMERTVSSVELSVSPNPFRDQLEILMNVTEDDNYTVNIYDVYGNLVEVIYSGKISAFEYNSFKVSLAHLAPGVYLVAVDNGNSQQVNARIIKQ